MLEGILYILVGLALLVLLAGVILAIPLLFVWNGLLINLFPRLRRITFGQAVIIAMLFNQYKRKR